MTKFQCAANCREEKTEHEFISEHGDYNEIYEIRCMVCNHLHKVNRHAWLQSEHIFADEKKSRKAGLTRYPYIEPHSGEIVTSKEHREETMKRLGFHEAPHGINENHHDETSEKIKKKRKEMLERRAYLQDRVRYNRALMR